MPSRFPYHLVTARRSRFACRLASGGQFGKVMFRDRERGDLRPCCHACRRDEIYDRSARITRATVRVQVPFEPYVLSLCDQHLAQVQHEFPGTSVKVTQRYGSAALGCHGL